jgi:hypothetical protein
MLETTIVNRIREAKKQGHSLLEIANKYGVAKSTVSLYCRDLFNNSQRVYPTKEIATKAIGYKHSQPCERCGKPASNNHAMCSPCRLDYRRTENDNPKCIYCGGCTMHAGIRRNKDGTSYQRHQCVKCGKHMKGVGAKNRFNSDTIDRLISKFPIEIREDAKQDIILRCLELGLNMNRADKVEVVVEHCLRKYKRDVNKQRFQEVSIYKQVSDEDNRTIADMIADPNSDFTKDIE